VQQIVKISARHPDRVGIEIEPGSVAGFGIRQIVGDKYRPAIIQRRLQATRTDQRGSTACSQITTVGGRC
jgi:hypothetical protein